MLVSFAMVSLGFISIVPRQPTTCHENTGPTLKTAVNGANGRKLKAMRNSTYDYPPSTGQELQVITQVHIRQHLNNHINPLVTNRFLHNKRNKIKVSYCETPSPAACFTEMRLRWHVDATFLRLTMHALK